MKKPRTVSTPTLSTPAPARALTERELASVAGGALNAYLHAIAKIGG